MSEIEKLPPCTTCESLPAPPDIDDDPPRTYDRLEIPADLEAHSPMRPADRRHRAHFTSVVATYEFDDFVKCSMPKAHRHKNGTLLRTRCGVLICVGRDCGSQLIDGYDRIERQIERSLAYQARVASVMADLNGLPERLAECLAGVGAMHRFRESIAASLPELATELRRRHSLRRDDDERTRVDLPRGHELRTGSTTVVRIGGIDLWDARMRPRHSLETALGGLQTLTTEWKRKLPSEAQAARAREQTNEITDWIREATRWMQHAESFFATESLRAALVASRAESAARAEKNTVVISQPGGAMRYGLGVERFEPGA